MLEGPFYFAWVNPDEGTFGAEHMRVDEDIFDFVIDHSEGDFATLSITVENPKIGFLAPGRKLWAWFAYNKAFDATASEATLSNAVPMFFGRLVGMPDDLDAETVALQFIARPADFAAQKAALAEVMKVAPYWDPIWFSEEARNDPDSVLESRPMVWAIDRTSLEVSASDITNGEDGTITFDEDRVFYDSVRVSYDGSPLRTVNVTATVSWAQVASGEVDISSYCGHGAAYSIVTYTGDKLPDNWPKPGASFDGGWKVGRSTIEKISGGKSVWMWGDDPVLGTLNPHFPGKTVLSPPWAFPQTVLGTRFPGHYLRVALETWKGTMTVAYDASRQRSETLTFSLSADVQKVLTEPDDAEALDLSFSSSEVASPIDPGGALPIQKPLKRMYFPTVRGTQSAEYLIGLARSRLIAAARCVRASFEISFEDAVELGLSLRKSGVLHDVRLPGALAAGKITQYQMSGSGDNGEFKASVTLACSVGRGGVVTAQGGTPTFAEEGVLTRDVQRYEGEYVLPYASDVAYSPLLGSQPVDDGFDFENMRANYIVKDVIKTNTATQQEGVIPAAAEAPKDVFDLLNKFPCTWEFKLRPIESGPFDRNMFLLTTDLKIAKTIDLEADVVSS
ncbi:hypothetical protein JQ608_06630 [Bradyrhizobium liaoningense]|uniref:hypothetical protein n=1 Tax=Bradyrhizobium liaoningense TaxID=43992 RepID=UPI001BA987EB|nr:hypothetical protein [Bradyrhizobium liaoningense]MBR0876876.1 hypothetical protein [Bradyrhizobium liaoningense]